MRVNLNQLHVFYLAARNGSMAAAAKALYVSAPAVTMQIKKLEGWLGFPVFERGQAELRLTEPGRGLYAAIEPLFSGLEDLEQYIESLVHKEEVIIRLGAHHVPGNYFIPDLIAHVQTKYPGFKVRMEIGTQDKLLAALMRKKLDLVLVLGELPSDAGCKTLHLFDEDLVLVADAGGAFGKLGSISIKAMDRIPLILQQRGGGALKAVEAFLRSHGAKPDILLDNLSSDLIKQFLLKMRAASFIGRFIVQKELDEGVLHEIKIEEGPPVYSFYLAYADTAHIPLKVRHFIAGAAGFYPKFHASPSPRDKA